MYTTLAPFISIENMGPGGSMEQESRPDEDRAWLRDKVRINAKMKYTPQKERLPIFQDEACIERACRAYEQLKPKSLLMEHAWLFNKAWIEHSADDRWSGQMNFEEREKQFICMRIDALQDIIAEYDVDGVLKLAKWDKRHALLAFFYLKFSKKKMNSSIHFRS